MAECWRFYPYLVKAKEMIDRGEIGEIFLIRVSSLSHYLPPLWRRNKKITGGGVLIDRGLHFIDMLLYLGGEADSVFARFGTAGLKEMEGEDTALGMPKFKNGVIGQVNISWATRKAFTEPHFIVYGTQGSIFARQGLKMCLSKGSNREEIVLDEREIVDSEMIDLTIRHFTGGVLHSRHGHHSYQYLCYLINNRADTILAIRG